MPNNVILFRSKVEYAEALINNIKSLGNSISDFSINISEVLQGVEENVRIMKEKVGNEKLAKKMFMDGIYIEAIGKIDEIIASLENSLLYLQIISNCNSINSLEDLDEVELNNIVNSLIEELKKVKMEDFSCFLDYDKTIRLLYETIYKIIKLEYINSCLTSSRLYDYVSSDEADRIFISTLIMEDIRLARESGNNTVKLEQIISKINTKPFDCEGYFNETLIKEITCIYERERIINISKKRVLSLSKSYQENLLVLEKSKKEHDNIEVAIVSVNGMLKKKKKQKIKDIIKAIISYIISISFLGILLVGPFLIKTKKVKTIKTVTNSTTLDLKKQEEDYLSEDDNYIYLEMFDPWKEEDFGYSRDTYKFSLPYEEYKDKDLEEILSYKHLIPLVMDLENAEKNTEFSLQLDYADLYIDTFYELIKIEQVPEDFIYTRSIQDQLPIILFAFVIGCGAFRGALSEYEDYLNEVDVKFSFFSSIIYNKLWLKNQRKHVWGKEEILKHKRLIKKLINNKEKLERSMAYLLSTNKEIEMKYNELLKEPALKDILNNFVRQECYELDSIDTFDISEGKKRTLKK